MYTTKPDTGTGRITLTRQGDTATVIDTTKISPSTDGSDTVTFTPPGRAPTSPPDLTMPFPADTAQRVVPPTTGVVPTGSSYPPVKPSDLADLRAHSPVIPVVGTKADKLFDSFDDRRGGTRRHEAIDIMAPRGTAVLSADAGTVLKLHNSAAGGLTIYIGDLTQRFIMLYAHLDRYRTGLTEGMTVKKGEIIGYVGSTGNASPTAPHLHFAIARSDNPKEWWKGTPLNPFLVWRGK
ncbi:MAG: peptidoglycan DD-metalloendopeptidase family protein [Gemmatimonadaceae bacterium]